MGLYDREYYRREGPSVLGHISQRGQICKWLIGITVFVFVIQIATMVREPFSGRMIPGGFTRALWLDPDLVIQGQVWRLLTHAFLHSLSIWHILFNMLLLWWLGHEIEEMYGSREFLAFYLLAAVFSGIVYTCTSLFQNAVAVGASGAVTAVMVLYACHFPRRIIYLWFVIPVPIWFLVVGFIAIDALVFVSGARTGIAVAGHLGGALFGFLYRKMGWRVGGLISFFADWNRRRRQPRLRVYREEPEPEPVGVASRPQTEADKQLEAKVDAVLAKVSEVGKEGLTEEEKELLLQASEIYRKRQR